MFLFTDNQIVNEGFVEDINNILNTGEVPGLFPADERDRIISEVCAAQIQTARCNLVASIEARFCVRTKVLRTSLTNVCMR